MRYVNLQFNYLLTYYVYALDWVGLRKNAPCPTVCTRVDYSHWHVNVRETDLKLWPALGSLWSITEIETEP